MYQQYFMKDGWMMMMMSSCLYSEYLCGIVCESILLYSSFMCVGQEDLIFKRGKVNYRVLKWSSDESNLNFIYFFFT